MKKLEKAVEYLQRLRANPNDIVLCMIVDEFIYNYNKEEVIKKEFPDASGETCPECSEDMVYEKTCYNCGWKDTTA